MLSDEERKQRRRLSQARSKVKEFESKARRAELRAGFWRRRVAELQFEQRAAYQPPLWPVKEPSDADAETTPNMG